VFRVPSLGIPDPARVVEPAGLVRYEAVALLAERGAAAVPGFRVDDENAADVARICFRLDGLPLAIELAAARLGALGTRTLADRLDDRFRLLRGGTRVAPSRQQTLSATLQWSHDLLADDERVLLRRLAVFAGGFQLEAAEAVCADDELPEVAVADVLARLVEKSLVATSAGGPELRYRLLETVRLYARERLDEAAETNAIARRQARWALARARQEGDSPQLDADAANLRIAHRSLAARDRLSYCVALLPFWMRRIDLEEAHRRLAAALDAAPERTELRADALMAESAIDFRAGTLRCGEDHAHESYEIARELGAAAVQRRALQRLGEFAVARDDAERAAAFFEQARSLARREGLSSGEALSIYSLGVVDWLVGDVDGAEGLIADSLTALGSAGDDELVSSPLNMAELRPAHKVAPLRLRIVFEETLHPFLEISCQAAIGYVLANQATIARLRGEPDRAALLLDDASRRFAGMGDLRGEAAVLIRRGHLELAVGALDAARQCFERSLELRRAMADRRGVGMALSGLGLTGILSGSYDLAARQLEEALELFRRAGDRWGIVSVLWRTADLAMACGDPEGARRALEDARAVVGETERQNWIDVTIAMQAEVARLRGPGERTGPRLARAAAESARPVQSGAAAMQTRRKSSSRTTGSSTTPKRRRT
jgi:tetratricopeptide (TPR) repeat protein